MSATRRRKLFVRRLSADRLDPPKKSYGRVSAACAPPQAAPIRAQAGWRRRSPFHSSLRRRRCWFVDAVVDSDVVVVDVDSDVVVVVDVDSDVVVDGVVLVVLIVDLLVVQFVVFIVV